MSITATALVAASLMSATVHGGSNFGMALSPASVTGPSNSVATFVVTDVGKVPLTVNTQVIELRPIAGHPGSYAPYGEADSWAKVSGSESFTLQPGQHHAVKVTIKAPTDHKYTLGLAATGQQATVKQGASIRAEAVARYTVNPQGTVIPDQSKPIVADNHAQPHSSPLVPIGALAGLSAMLLALGVWLKRRAKRRHA